MVFESSPSDHETWLSAQSHHSYVRPSPNGSFSTNNWLSLSQSLPFFTIIHKCKATIIYEYFTPYACLISPSLHNHHEYKVTNT